jgi:hypothetical protein
MPPACLHRSVELSLTDGALVFRWTLRATLTFNRRTFLIQLPIRILLKPSGGLLLPPPKFHPRLKLCMAPTA